MQETQFQSLGWEDPLEKEMATNSSILAWRIPWTEEPGELQSMGSQRVGHNWVTNTLNFLSNKKTFFSGCFQLSFMNPCKAHLIRMYQSIFNSSPSTFSPVRICWSYSSPPQYFGWFTGVSLTCGAPGLMLTGSWWELQEELSWPEWPEE